MTALLHWEFFLGQAWHAYVLLTRGGPVFDKGEDSTEERLNSLYNEMKHAESRIVSGQIIDGATVPVWLVNEGIQSTDTLLTYRETGEILRDVARWADIVVDPKTTTEKLQAYLARSEQETGTDADG